MAGRIHWKDPTLCTKLPRRQRKYSQSEARLHAADKVVKVVIFILLIPLPPDVLIEKPVDRQRRGYHSWPGSDRLSKHVDMHQREPEVLQSEGSLIKVPRLFVDHVQFLQEDFVLSGLQQRHHGVFSEFTASGVTLQWQHEPDARLQILQL